MRAFYLAALLLSFAFGCYAHLLVQPAHATSKVAQCASAGEVRALHVRIVALEDRLQAHSESIRDLFIQALGLQHECRRP